MYRHALRNISAAVARSGQSSARPAPSTVMGRPVLSQAMARRHMGMFDELKEKFKGELDKNKDMKKALEDLEKDENLKRAGQFFSQAKSTVGQGAKKFGETASVGGDALKGSLQAARESLSELRDRVDVSELTDLEVVKKLKEQRAKLKDKFGDAAEAADLDEKIKKAEEALKTPKKEKPKPVREEDIDRETFAVAERPKTAWERQWEKVKDTKLGQGIESVQGFLRDRVSPVMTVVGDRVFRETETAHVLREIRQHDQDFDMYSFVDAVRTDSIPMLMEAVIRSDSNKLKSITSEALFHQLSAMSQAREAQGIRDQSRILDIHDVELLSAKMMDNKPVVVVAFVMQQTNHLVDAQGVAVEDSEVDDIRTVHYLVAYRHEINEMTDEASWKVCELAVRGMYKSI